MKDGDIEKDIVVVNGVCYVPLQKDLRGHIGIIGDVLQNDKPKVIMRADRTKEGLPFISFWNKEHDKEDSKLD